MQSVVLQNIYLSITYNQRPIFRNKQDLAELFERLVSCINKWLSSNSVCNIVVKMTLKFLQNRHEDRRSYNSQKPPAERIDKIIGVLL